MRTNDWGSVPSWRGWAGTLGRQPLLGRALFLTNRPGHKSRTDVAGEDGLTENQMVVSNPSQALYVGGLRHEAMMFLDRSAKEMGRILPGDRIRSLH